MDVTEAINNVVNSVKSDGLFDQFRKECLEEFEMRNAYIQLKEQVENHVESFLSKYRTINNLQKNTLRADLRNNISKSEDLLLSVQRLVDEVLSIKGHSICLRIDKKVDKYLNEQANINKPEESSLPQTDEPQVPPHQSFEQQQVNQIDVNHDATSGLDTNETNQGLTSEWTEIEEVEMEINESVNDATLPQGIENTIENITPESPNETEESTVSKGTPTLDEIELPEKFTINIGNTLIIDPNKAAPDKNVLIHNSVTDKNQSQSIAVKIDPDSKENLSDNKKEVLSNAFPKTEKYAPITEPISDDSSSNDSSINEGDRQEYDEFDITNRIPYEQRRKSSRVRTLPLKLREIEETKNRTTDRTTDTESISSIDIEPEDIKKHGRPRLKHKGREHSVSPLTISRDSSREKHRKRRRSPSTNSESGQSGEKKKIKYLDKIDEIKKPRRTHERLSDFTSDRSTDISEETYSKRTGRAIKQRQCYSPS